MRELTIQVTEDGRVTISVTPGILPTPSEGLRAAIEAKAMGTQVPYDVEVFMLESLHKTGYAFMNFLYPNRAPALAREGMFEIDLDILRQQVQELHDVTWLEGKIPFLLAGGLGAVDRERYWGTAFKTNTTIRAYPVLYPPNLARRLFQSDRLIVTGFYKLSPSTTVGNMPHDEGLSSDITNKMLSALVFFCYASEDCDTVEKIYEVVDENGFKTWWDHRNLMPGQDWDKEITLAIEEAAICLVFLSNNSVHKTGYVNKEIKLILDKMDMMPEGRVFIVPIRLDDCAIPNRLSKWQVLEYSQSNWEEQLIAGIRHAL